MSKLSKISTGAPKHFDKQEIQNETQTYLEKLRELQRKLFAQGKYGVLVVLQGLDASGKDGVVNDVFSNLNLLGCRVAAFKAPSSEELKHDFLWRIHREVPGNGTITIFNRSHYEDVLVPVVNKQIPKHITRARYEHINNFEALLIEQGTVVIKFYLHVSKEVQLERLKERLSNPKKYWKHDDNDWTVEAERKTYLEAYQQIFKHCSESAPWNIVPADKHWYRNYLIAREVVKSLEKLDLKFPALKVGSSKTP